MASRLAAQRRLRWYGHVLRRSADHPTHAILRFEPSVFGWQRPRGRPRTRWLDIISLDLFALGITREDALSIAQNRSQ